MFTHRGRARKIILDVTTTPEPTTNPPWVSQQVVPKEHHLNLLVNRSHRILLLRSVSSPAIGNYLFHRRKPHSRVDDPVYPHFDIYPSWACVQVVPATKQVSKTRKSHRELQEEVFFTSILSRGSASQPRSVPVLSLPLYPTYPALEIC